jgi:hypothetical protein
LDGRFAYESNHIGEFAWGVVTKKEDRNGFEIGNCVAGKFNVFPGKYFPKVGYLSRKCYISLRDISLSETVFLPDHCTAPSLKLVSCLNFPTSGHLPVGIAICNDYSLSNFV